MARDLWYRERLEPLQHRLGHGGLREHFARYRFAAGLLRGRVLDGGCGTGYGAAMLADSPGVTEVLGVDRDLRAIRHAQRYYGVSRARFQSLDLLDPGLGALGTFDGIACLEVLEHVAEPERLLAALDLGLAPGGQLLVSTPLGRGRFAPTRQPGHAFQLRRAEFAAMLRPRFRFRLFGQKGEGIESWRPGGRYFLMLALCRSRCDGRGGGGSDP
jgi:2-polyprenyl-3-methyl-5-hydroxy-6-metoxy-1,4-benzoquinol methylase